MKYKLTCVLVAALTSTAFAAFQAPLPEFKNEKQLAEWRAEKASEATSQGDAAEETAFYTGKPYLASSGGYAFKYRIFNPALARWTSNDPSGFPDGANGSFYAPNPTSEIDPNGLWKLQLVGARITYGSNSGTVDTGFWNGMQDEVSAATLYTDNITASSTGTTGTVHGIALGDIMNLQTALQVQFDISINTSNGQIQIGVSGSGGWDTVDGDLSGAANWDKSIGNHTATLTLSAASMCQGSGLSGAGLAGVSLSWSGGNSSNKVSSYTTLSFRAVE